MSGNRTSLTDEEYKKALHAALRFVAEHQSITKQQLRAQTGLGYDQAIRALGRMVEAGELLRTGAGGGTKYVLRATE